LSVVTRLERRYAGFDGLNLTYETLEGLVKHNGPLTDTSGRAIGRHAAHGVAPSILDYNAVQDLELALYPSAEAQAGAIADDIAYDAHDIDDGLRARMFAIDELAALPLIGDILAEIEKGSRPSPPPPSLTLPRPPPLPSPASGGGKGGGSRGREGQVQGGSREGGLEPARRVHELVRRLIARMIEDVIGLQVGVLFTGAILTETIFSWPGVGKWLIEAINRRDYPVLQGGTLLIGAVVMAVNLMVELAYGLINPRIRHIR